MIFEPLALPGAFRILLEKRADARGHFARTYCAQEFAEHGLGPVTAQCNTSFNARRGTLRGLHWQAEPHAEDKLVRATRGAVWDVLVDLRPESPAYRQWHGEELTEDNGVSLYVPRGFAHGFLTLRDDSEVFYQMSAFYEGSAARGARFDDPAFGIVWPLAGAPLLSERDAAFPSFTVPPSATKDDAEGVA